MLVEGLAEMAQAVVADFQGGFSDIVASRPQELGSAFETNLAQVLGERLTGFLGESPAEIKRAAADLAAELFEGWRMNEVATEDSHNTFDPVARNPLLAMAKKLVGGRRMKKELARQFRSLGLIPDRLGTGEDRWLAEAANQIALTLAQGSDGTQSGCWLAKNDGLDDGMQMVGGFSKNLFKKCRCQLDGDKLVRLAVVSRCLQGLASGMIISGSSSLQMKGVRSEAYRGFAGEVQAELEASRMKTGGPVEFA